MAGVASQAGDADSSRSPRITSGLQGPWMSTVVLYFWCHSDGASGLLYLTFVADCLHEILKNWAPTKYNDFTVFFSDN